MRSKPAILALNFVVCLMAFSARAEKETVAGYILSLPTESTADREARHKKIAARRQVPIIIVHRGASAFAAENTLESYAAAMDYGADGCEIDIRRTQDGVLVMFHDPGLERMTDALGPIDQYAYRDIAALRFRSIYNAAPQTGIPTLAAVFELARQRAMFLHLDIKEPGLEADIGRLLDDADIWDHVIAINDYNSAQLRSNPRFAPLVYKAPGLGEDRLDLDPVSVEDALAKPGQMIMVDDPRVAARASHRPTQIVPLPDRLRAPVTVALSARPSDTNVWSIPRFSREWNGRVDNRSLPGLEKALAADFTERTQLGGGAVFQRRRLERILERSWAALKIAQLGARSTRAVKLLEQQLQNRSLHLDWAYHGLDGAMAARALGELRATESVPVLARTFYAVDPELKKVVQPPASYPSAWADFRLKSEIMTALGELRCPQSKKFLFDYVALDRETAVQSAPPLFEEATRSLLRQELTPKELEALLRSPNRAVRGTAILECLDHPPGSRVDTLRAVLPWTKDLPSSSYPRR